MKRTFCIAAICALTIGAAQADEVTDTLQSAIDAYNDGDIEFAMEEIVFAQQLLKELRAGALEAFLPEAPDGWTREADESDRMAAMAMMGGGTGAAAEYSNGSDRFTITIMMDNPMVMAMGNVFGNAAVMASQGKMVRVGREKFIDQDGQLTGMIDGRVLVQAEGASIEVMLPIVETMDFRELGRFGL